MARNREPGSCQILLGVRLHLPEVTPQVQQVGDGKGSDDRELQRGDDLELAELVGLGRYARPECHHCDKALQQDVRMCSYPAALMAGQAVVVSLYCLAVSVPLPVPDGCAVCS